MINSGFRAPEVKPGGSIAHGWKALQKEEENWRIPFQGDFLQWQMPGGTILQQRGLPNVFLHPWRVTLSVTRSAQAAVIRPGRVNGVIPNIGDVRLDGYISKDQPTGPVPTLDLKDGPGPDMESWICVQTAIDLATGKWIEKNPLTLVHVQALDPAYNDGGSPDQNGLGREPIAVVIWQDKKTIRYVDQTAMHDLHHRYEAPATGAGNRGRHFFWV